MLDQALTFGDGLDALRWALAASSLLASLAYLAIVDRSPSLWRTGFKTASIALWVPLPLLGLHVEGASTLALVSLAAAFLFSSLGDYFLALKGDARNFPRGLASFLVAHIFYLIVLAPLVSAPAGWQLWGIAAVAIFAIASLAWLWPKLGAFRAPVILYMAVISLMAVAAFSVPLPWLGIGALLFVFSDVVIAVNKFRMPVPRRGHVVWITYYGGQALIAASLIGLLR